MWSEMRWTIGSSLLLALLVPVLISIAKRVQRREHVNVDLAKNWHRVPPLGLTESIGRWGSYTPGIYQGLRTSTAPAFFCANVLWFSDLSNDARYNTGKDDSIFFEWVRHNGVDYGVQDIQDSKHRMNVNARFMVNGGAFTWVQRLEVSAVASSGTSSNKYLTIQLGLDCDTPGECPALRSSGSGLRIERREVAGSSESYLIHGVNTLLKRFTIEVNIHSTSSAPILTYSASAMKTVQGNVDDLMSYLRNVPSSFPYQLDNRIDSAASAMSLCFRSSESFVVDLVMHEDSSIDSSPSTSSAEITSLLDDRGDAFDRKFRSAFPMTVSDPTSGDEAQHAFSAQNVAAAQKILSSVLGGLGYFHGSPRLGDAPDTVPLESAPPLPPAPITLYSACPSRTAFPRGFLWDEGFHQLLILRWSPEISMRVLASWLDAMYTSSSSTHGVIGWIPREMILGAEAAKRVPDEFVTQRVTVANPPTLLLVVERLHAIASHRCNADTHTGGEEAITRFLRGAYPRLHAWVQGLLETQRSSSADGALAFRWRGRSASDGKFIANTLASGLDDYPRSLLPSEEERHLDLYCWLTKAALIMQTLQRDLFVGESLALDLQFDYAALATRLQSGLDETHWSSEHAAYLDVGMHTEVGRKVTEVAVRCASDAGHEDFAIPTERMQESPANRGCPPSHPSFVQVLLDPRSGEEMTRTRRVPFNMTLQHVPRMGYVSLFPLLLTLIPPESDTLPAVLDVLEDSTQLWSPYGVRSLSSKDVYYNRNNAQHDTPYWR